MYITCSQEPTQNLMAIWMGTMMRLRIGFRGSSHGTFSENPMSCGVCVISHWLVVSTNHPEKWWTSSVGMMTFQIWWDKKNMFQTTNQSRLVVGVDGGKHSHKRWAWFLLWYLWRVSLDVLLKLKWTRATCNSNWAVLRTRNVVSLWRLVNRDSDNGLW